MKYEPPKYIGDLEDRFNENEREFPKCDFRSHESINNLIFDEISLPNCLFDKTHLLNISFRNAQLENSNFEYCEIENVDFENAKLDGCKITGASFTNCNFKGTSFESVIWNENKLTTDEFIKHFATRNNNKT